MEQILGLTLAGNLYIDYIHAEQQKFKVNWKYPKAINQKHLAMIIIFSVSLRRKG